MTHSQAAQRDYSQLPCQLVLIVDVTHHARRVQGVHVHCRHFEVIRSLPIEFVARCRTHAQAAKQDFSELQSIKNQLRSLMTSNNAENDDCDDGDALFREPKPSRTFGEDISNSQRFHEVSAANDAVKPSDQSHIAAIDGETHTSNNANVEPNEDSMEFDADMMQQRLDELENRFFPTENLKVRSHYLSLQVHFLFLGFDQRYRRNDNDFEHFEKMKLLRTFPTHSTFTNPTMQVH